MMMVRLIMSMATMVILAACGADGAPHPPEPGVTISGEARLGMVGTL